MKNILYNKTKIIATIGPSSSDINILKEMVIAGVDVVRLNFSHGEKEFHKQIIKNVRKISEELNVPVCILQDLQGPKIRVGEILNDSFLNEFLQKNILNFNYSAKINIYKNLFSLIENNNTIHTYDFSKNDFLIFNEKILNSKSLNFLNNSLLSLEKNFEIPEMNSVGISSIIELKSN